MRVRSYHQSCLDNYWFAFAKLAVGPTAEEIKQEKALKGRVKYTELMVALNAFFMAGDSIPDTLRLFRNVQRDEPISKARNYARLEALQAVVVATGACPDDVCKSNGETNKLFKVHYEVAPEVEQEYSGAA
ncbi:uncharacterized protein N0V89_001092 [Didymosphaeria variabile]|uniref:Uncharacterized protein n=1 Tax=Didymosphaeria variabile TaxID=1932322 RepID=A0A9W9CGD5_9PLEO|nr:uncharacterized protein N0V89_001092 [Didymosphaeria variabile]KAJ4360527.1 hypothetical protein N0V89_001092 [Didymosphaeria variabile]